MAKKNPRSAGVFSERPRLLGGLHFGTTVERAALFGRVVGLGRALTVSKGVDAAGIDALLHEVAAHGVGATLGERLVECVRIRGVGVALNLQFQRRIALERFQRLQRLLGIERNYAPALVDWLDEDQQQPYLDAFRELILPATEVLVGNHKTLQDFLLPVD